MSSVVPPAQSREPDGIDPEVLAASHHRAMEIRQERCITGLYIDGVFYIDSPRLPRPTRLVLDDLERPKNTPLNLKQCMSWIDHDRTPDRGWTDDRFEKRAS